MNYESTEEACVKAINDMVEAKSNLDQAEIAMNLAGLKVEMRLINKSGGDEKKLGPSEASRKRAFDLAREDDRGFKMARENYLSASATYRFHSGMADVLKQRLKFLTNQ